MNKYTLSRLMFGIPMSEDFEAGSDDFAIGFAHGFVACEIGLDRPMIIGSKWRLDRPRMEIRDGVRTHIIDETTLIGMGIVEDRDGNVGQVWEVVRRRYRDRSKTSTNVPDPHDEPEED